ncbi:MAG: hypothetical protein AAGH89_06455 [Verrucomicrobiota bacterium]
MKTLSVLFGLVLAIASPSVAQWPEFRGPTLDGHAAPDAQFPTEWSESKNVTWKTPLHGKGWSTPVVWGDQIWLTTATDDGKKQSAICINKHSGKVLFDEILFENAEPRPLSNNRNTYASPSPVIEAGKIYGTFPDIRLAENGGADDIGNGGRILPTTSTDKFFSEMATWFGVTSGDMATVLPNLSKFSTEPSLGFIS